MEASCRCTANRRLFHPPCNPHIVTVMVVELVFHKKYPNGVGNALSILLFPALYPFAGLEEDPLKRKWDAILGGDTLASFLNTSLLMGNQKVAPIAG